MPFVDAALARRLEEGHARRSLGNVQASARLRPMSGSEARPLAGGFLIYGGPDSPLRSAVGLGFAGPVTAADLDEMETFYRRRGAHPRVELSPLAHPSLLALLRERGYRLEQFLNLLCRQVPQTPLPVRLPPGGRIRAALPEDGDVWIRTTSQGFEEVDSPSAATLAIIATNFHSDLTTCYLAWQDGEPVAGAAMSTYEKITEFGGTSTRVPYRGRGYQTALLHTRLNTARDLGCTHALVISTPGSPSQRNVERAGFQVVYTKAMMVLPS